MVYLRESFQTFWVYLAELVYLFLHFVSVIVLDWNRLHDLFLMIPWRAHAAASIAGVAEIALEETCMAIVEQDFIDDVLLQKDLHVLDLEV